MTDAGPELEPGAREGTATGVASSREIDKRPEVDLRAPNVRVMGCRR
jgi:hypothetical protein